MSAPIELKAHLSCGELRARYRSTRDPVERARFQALWLLASGEPREEVVRTMGYTAEWVRRTVVRYNALGPQGMSDGRHQNRGHTPLLSPEQCAELEGLLEGSAPDGTPWSGPKVAHWMAEQLGRRVAPQRGWDYLRRLGQTPQRPRPQHQSADPEAQSCFQASSAARL